MLDVRKEARSAVTAMLASASGGDEDPAVTERVEWKVLILDESCREVLAPLFSVNELRKKGVTSHLALESEKREPIEDACGVYLCRPTETNASRIAVDVGKRLYGRVHVNFAGRTERRVLEKMARDLAATLGENDPLPRVPVWDRPLDFVALEPRLFTSLSSRADKAVSLARCLQFKAGLFEEETDLIAAGLASAVETMFGGGNDSEFSSRRLPLVRARPGTSAASVGESLCRKLAEAAKRRKAQAQQRASQGAAGLRASQPIAGRTFASSPEVPPSKLARPLVVILDRTDDLMTPLRHTESYQALVDDVLEGYAKNRVKVGDATFDLAVDGEDEFFGVHALRSLPDVIDASSADLAELRDAERRVRARTAERGTESSSKNLVDAVGELPALLEKKKRLEAHTTILGKIMQSIADRELPTYYDAEERASRKNLDKKTLTDLLGDDAKGTTEDKLRLLFVALFAAKDSGLLDDLTFFEKIVTDAAAKKTDDDEGKKKQQQERIAKAFRALREAKRILSLSSTSLSWTQQQQQKDEAPPSFAKTMLNRAQAGASKLVDKASQSVTAFLAAKSGFACTILQDLIDTKGNYHDTFLCLDPSSSSKQHTEPPSDVIVFLVGGGCYAEYHALQAKFQGHAGRAIVYGATDLKSPELFLQDLVTSCGGPNAAAAAPDSST